VPIPGVVPLPSTAPIPIPGSLPIEGVVVSGGQSRLFTDFSRFGCGVSPGGVIVIVVDTCDRHGKLSSSELRVAVR
jgi:hypothetical protein